MRQLIVGLVLVFTATAVLADDPCPLPWTYPDQEAWGGFCRRSGDRQSPVDLGNATYAPPQNLVIHYGRLPFDVTNTSRTAKMKFAFSEQNYVRFGSTTYYLEELHFHVPAEHGIDGRFNVMEMHIVNKTKDKTKALALGVLFIFGTSSDVLHTILQTVPPTSCNTGHASGDFNPVGTILPNTNQSNNWWTYDGSLTTPGCDPVVTFVIFKTTLPVSAADERRLGRIFGLTARDPQRPLPVKKTWH